MSENIIEDIRAPSFSSSDINNANNMDSSNFMSRSNNLNSNNQADETVSLTIEPADQNSPSTPGRIGIHCLAGLGR